MQVTSISIPEKLVVLGVGGTIAGTASNVDDNIGYTAAQLGVEQLLEAVPGLARVMAGRALVTEQVAQIDSKDMSFAVWRQLALRSVHYLVQPDVKAIIVTHGTDTLEETAFFLHSVLPASQLVGKPVVLTCAMRPASSLAPDGPQNLMDAVTVASTPGASGVLVVCAGAVHGAVDVQKVHPYRVDAFNSGDAGPVGYVEEGRVRQLRSWPMAGDGAIEKIARSGSWPRVDIVMNYAGATGAMVDALVTPGVPGADAAGVRGLVVAATGNGTVHQDLEAALLRARAAGVKILLATRCGNGRVLPTIHHALPDSQGLSPVKARVALMLSLMY